MLIFASFALILHITSITLAMMKQRSKPLGMIVGTPKVTILRPVCGLENNLKETLTSTFGAEYPNFEILFCVARADDAVIPLVRCLIAEHPKVSARLLIGDAPISGNPKLNNLVKGWAAAQSDWILMADSNVLLPPDFITRLFVEWRDDTGLVTSPPAGIRPIGFAARLECAFLNGFQGRWQLASAQMNNGFAQGKMLFWRRDLLDQAGGLAALGTEMAEDVAATKLVRGRGHKVRLTARLFAQPIGQRDLPTVWARQLRWSKVRRLGFLPLFFAEAFAGSLLPLAAVIGATSPFGVLAYFVVWYGGEYLLAKTSGWPANLEDILAWICRDILLPVLWVAAWFGNGFEWRGNAMQSAKTDQHLAKS